MPPEPHPEPNTDFSYTHRGPTGTVIFTRWAVGDRMLTWWPTNGRITVDRCEEGIWVPA